MLLDAEVKEDGTMIANLPKSLWGKKVKIIVRDPNQKSRSRKKRSQWDEIAPILEDARNLAIPRRTIDDILQDLHTFRETL